MLYLQRDCWRCEDSTCIEIINIITIVLLLNSNAETQIMTHGKCETKNIPMGHANAKELVNCNDAIATNQFQLTIDDEVHAV